jgi:hypothetical protein
MATAVSRVEVRVVGCDSGRRTMMTYRCRRFRSRGPAVVRWDGEAVATSPWSPSLPRPRLIRRRQTGLER